MPTYCFICLECGNTGEKFCSIDVPLKPLSCTKCEIDMIRDFRAEGVNDGNKEYGQTKWSDSLAISPTQIEEHKKLFPDVRVDKEGRIGFDNFRQHDNYLDKCGFVKHPQKIRKHGKKIA